MKKILQAAFVTISVCLFSLSLFAQDDSTSARTDEDDMPQQEKVEPAKSCHERITFGVEAGVNVANYIYGQTLEGQTFSSDAIVGGRAGVIVDIPLHGIFYIQPGLFYAMNGGTNNELQNTWYVNTLELPANLILKFGAPDRVRFFAGGGPFAGYNISGTYKYGTSGDLKIGSAGNDNLKTFDVGFGINAGVELPIGLIFRLRYQQGFTNLEPLENLSYSSVYSSSYGAQVAFLFGRMSKREMKPHTSGERVWDQ